MKKHVKVSILFLGKNFENCQKRTQTGKALSPRTISMKKYFIFGKCVWEGQWQCLNFLRIV